MQGGLPPIGAEVPQRGAPPPIGGEVPQANFATTNETDAQGNALVRGATEFYNKSPLAPAVATAYGLAHVVAHPLDTYFGLAPLAETAKSAIKAQWDQAVQAAQKAKETMHGGGMLSASEAFGHGLAAVLPLLGPAAADVGEHIGRGDYAGGVGGALGLLAPFAVKYGMELKNAADPAKADLLRREAEKQVSEQVLAPGNPSYKPVAQKIAPEVLSRKLQGSRLELQQLADEGKADALGRIDAAVNIDPAAPVALTPVVQALNDRIGELQVHGKTVPGAESLVNALKTQRDFVSSHGSSLPFAEVRKLRQILDDQAAEAKAYVGRNQPLSDLGKASADAAGALRETLAANRPEAVAPNADYTFFKSLSDVLDPARGRPKAVNFVPSGVTGGMSTTGAVIGQALSNVPVLRGAAALITSQLLPMLKAALASPEWQLTSATKKMALSEALKNGQIGTAQRLLLNIAAAAPRAGVEGLSSMPAAASTPATAPDQGR